MIIKLEINNVQYSFYALKSRYPARMPFLTVKSNHLTLYALRITAYYEIGLQIIR